MKIKMTLAVAALLTIGLSSAAAYADSVTFTLSNPNEDVLATGGSYTYDGTVTAAAGNSGAVFFNGDSYNVTAPVTLDDTDFAFNLLGLSLAPGDSFTGDLFTLTAPPGTPFGSYLGTFSLMGGSDMNANDTLGTADFGLTATPEPSSIILLLTGMSGLFLWAGFKGNLRGWAR